MDMLIFYDGYWDIYIMSQTEEATLDVRVAYCEAPGEGWCDACSVTKYEIPASLEGELRALGDKARKGLVAPREIENFLWQHKVA